MLLDRIKESLKRFKIVWSIRNWFLWHFAHNQIMGKKGNDIRYMGGGYQNTSLSIYGKENLVRIEYPDYVDCLKMVIRGNNNRVHIHGHCVIRNVNIWIEDDNNVIEIDESTLLFGMISINCIEGTTVHIGNNCMLASDVYLRTGDSHSVLDRKGNRINPSKSIKIGDHCWIGQDSVLLKGVILPSNTIVGAASVVSKPFAEEYTAIAGNPAKVIKHDIDWCRERI